MKKNKSSSKFSEWLSGDIDLLSPSEEKPSAPKAKKVKAPNKEALKAIEAKQISTTKALYVILAVVLCLGLMLIMMMTVSFLPNTDLPDSPTNNEVAGRYIEKSIEETGSINMVTGMILDYRAFDTLGESHVLFTGMCAVFILIMDDHKNTSVLKAKPDPIKPLYDTKKDIIVTQTAKVLVPVTILYGIYVILNGHLSPGGGFSGGTIIGAALILYSMAYGFENTEKVANKKVLRGITLASLAFYSLSKCYSFFTGANELPSIIKTGTPGNIISAGLILPLNIAVGLVVACTMYGLYSVFRRERI